MDRRYLLGASSEPEEQQELWNWLADRLIPTIDGFDTDATMLLLAYAATSRDTQLLLDTIGPPRRERTGSAGS